MPKLHLDICKIKDIFVRNGYAKTIIDKCFNVFLIKLFVLKWIVQSAVNQKLLFYPIWALSRLN